MTIAAVLDADVLYPIALADFFITAAGLGLYRAHWSPQILDEVARNLAANRPDLSPEQIARRLAAMERAMPAASVEPPQAMIDQMANQAKDRHVLAAAVLAEAGFVVTFNIRDFPEEACAPHDVVAETPDLFATRMVVDDPALVRTAMKEMAGRRRHPPATPDEIIDHLGLRLPEAMRELRAATGADGSGKDRS